MVFYFAETTISEQRLLLCRWAEWFHDKGQKVHVAVESTQSAQFIDGLLWTFSQGSFVPHGVFSPERQESPMEPVLIVIGENRVPGFDVILCDTSVSVEFLQQFETVVHFILRDDLEKKQDSRVLWQKVRELGINPVHVPYGRQAGMP